jgi:hypothetical protein
MYGSDEIGKLTGPNSMMSEIIPDDFRREKWVNGLSVHAVSKQYISVSITTKRKTVKDVKTSLIIDLARLRPT